MDDTAGAGGPARGSEPGSLLAFLFGVAGREELPGPVIVTLMGDCGMSEAATRSLLARLRRGGDLAVSRSGRVTTYALAGVMREAWLRGRARGSDEGVAGTGGGGAVGQAATGEGGAGVAASGANPAGAGPGRWDGRLHGILYTVPERERSFRDALRRAARLAGYGPLRPGLVVAPRDAWAVVSAHVGPPPAGARITPLELVMDRADAAAAVAEAWDLAAVAAQYRELRAALEGVATAPVAPDAATLRAYERVTRPAFSAFARHPDLPAELLPDDWPADELSAALRRVVARHAHVLAAYVDELLADVETGA